MILNVFHCVQPCKYMRKHAFASQNTQQLSNQKIDKQDKGKNEHCINVKNTIVLIKFCLIYKNNWLHKGFHESILQNDNSGGKREEKGPDKMSCLAEKRGFK